VSVTSAATEVCMTGTCRVWTGSWQAAVASQAVIVSEWGRGSLGAALTGWWSLSMASLRAAGKLWLPLFCICITFVSSTAG
jgi:hypothetical protein